MSQSFSVGVKGGVPLTSMSDSAREFGRYGGQTNFQMKRYGVGPTVEIGLPFRLRLEADALYRHARQDRLSGPAPYASLNQEGARIGIWEIPLLLKYQWQGRGFQPFVVGGSTLRRVGDLDVDLIAIPAVPGYPGTRQHYTISADDSLRYGVTFGGGVSHKVGFMIVEPELRFTHWTSQHWMATTEQLEFLVGIKFPLRTAD